MSLWIKGLAAVACATLLAALSACGSEPDSPLVLGSEAEAGEHGMRTLTSAQGRALQRAVTSAQESCDAVERAYLRNVDAGRSESWDVLCSDGVYSVQVFADGTAADVRRCYGWSPEGCADPFFNRRFRPADRQFPDGRAQPGRLNPDLGKLLEEMDQGKATSTPQQPSK